MCGITGLWLPHPAPAHELEAAVAPMAAAIAHRGPDDAGVWCDPDAGLALGHRRLAILDLSPAGHQPMRSTCGRYVLIFNGEIYNHVALRRELECGTGQAAPWRGRSDTETLLAALQGWGLPQALERCAGMFALALWDRRERVLHLARDRFGEKPLYVGQAHPGPRAPLVFGSDLAALRAMPGFAAPIRPDAIAALLGQGAIPAPLTIHGGIHQLPPGHLLSIGCDRQGCAPAELPAWRCWWDLQAVAAAAMAEPLSSEAEALEALHHSLATAVRDQRHADVPLGAFLSGGIDSSLVTALLQAEAGRRVRSFTIGFAESGFNEAPHARAIAERLGTEHTEVLLSAADALRLIPELPRIYAEPFADSSQIPTHLVCREARRAGLQVALSGDGGDELFGGYNRHRFAPLLHRRLGRLPPPLLRALAAGLERLPVSRGGLARDKLQKLAAAVRVAGSLEAIQQSLTSLWPQPELLLQRGSPILSQPAHLPAAPTASQRLMLADTLTYLPSDPLVKLDRAAMAVGLETRLPFLDHRVAQLAWRLPAPLLIGPLGGKLALRRLLAAHLPPALFERPKAGFALPLGPWLRGALRSWAEDLLDPVRMRRQGHLRPEPIQCAWRQHIDGRADHSARLWSVLMWQAWLEVHQRP
ncbi:asparagine synthase (glutamine-hydrolyzing) [Synechococcus sp. GFB01]|uniref:asparagine synthase (glutamine-hydrolyzing) n=1 Tax=Synechococcus sp. GFB01 TaxID=1662190 RepID=UPI00064EC861|nr:asparagine synthase (glutamine-hydrolyzing) [Synechococcus sp. GFB01]KMM17584.1 hypothetical protein SYNGFB01_03140 [Synechococcus sp. GFB01]